ncbi:hypothetical protein BDP27DRAFT_1378275 [Rhodocollybia butyracea]|uniref:Uncharacterized protein n=1 Tax=Rhodocollybia butyracea TaxID=206335 RepID=A0A9P5P454_9AGAR|nr:hypothetical protein BDP27DRAFT_1378275 [Rhodocollybia butyracea]
MITKQLSTLHPMIFHTLGYSTTFTCPGNRDVGLGVWQESGQTACFCGQVQVQILETCMRVRLLDISMDLEDGFHESWHVEAPLQEGFRRFQLVLLVSFGSPPQSLSYYRIYLSLSSYLPTSFFPCQPNIHIVDGSSHSNLTLVLSLTSTTSASQKSQTSQKYKPPPLEAVPSGSSLYPSPNILPHKYLSTAFAAKLWLSASTMHELLTLFLAAQLQSCQRCILLERHLGNGITWNVMVVGSGTNENGNQEWLVVTAGLSQNQPYLQEVDMCHHNTGCTSIRIKLKELRTHLLPTP